MISVKTIIGFGAPKQGTQKVHGAALNADDTKTTKQNLGVDWPAFTVPKDVQAHYKTAAKRGAQTEADWNKLFKSYAKKHKALAAEFERTLKGDLPEGFDKDLPTFQSG